MRAHAALLLLSVAITSALRMNNKSEANRDLIITRLPVLAIRDVQYPLTEAKAD
jgi:cytochrome c556